MMLHLLYTIAFTALALLAITNLIRNLISLGFESQRPYGGLSSGSRRAPHPELLDETGRVINEPLLVMRSMSMDDARDHLNALYDSSPGATNLNSELREEH